MIEIGKTKYYTISEVSGLMDINEIIIHKRIRKGKIKSIIKGCVRYISEAEMEEMTYPGEIAIPERYPDCIGYDACIDNASRQEVEEDRIFGCVKCLKYEKGQLIERSW